MCQNLPKCDLAHSLQWFLVVSAVSACSELDTSSIFIDVGAGLGKPNLHVAINPAVRYSVGVEMEHVRWHLSMHNLKHYLDTPCTNPEEEKKKCTTLPFFLIIRFAKRPRGTPRPQNHLGVRG